MATPAGTPSPGPAPIETPPAALETPAPTPGPSDTDVKIEAVAKGPIDAAGKTPAPAPTPPATPPVPFSDAEVNEALGVVKARTSKIPTPPPLGRVADLALDYVEDAIATMKGEPRRFPCTTVKYDGEIYMVEQRGTKMRVSGVGAMIPDVALKVLKKAQQQNKKSHLFDEQTLDCAIRRIEPEPFSRLESFKALRTTVKFNDKEYTVEQSGDKIRVSGPADSADWNVKRAVLMELQDNYKKTPIFVEYNGKGYRVLLEGNEMKVSGQDDAEDPKVQEAVLKIAEKKNKKNPRINGEAIEATIQKLGSGFTVLSNNNEQIRSLAKSVLEESGFMESLGSKKGWSDDEREAYLDRILVEMGTDSIARATFPPGAPLPEPRPVLDDESLLAFKKVLFCHLRGIPIPALATAELSAPAAPEVAPPAGAPPAPAAPPPPAARPEEPAKPKEKPEPLSKESVDSESDLIDFDEDTPSLPEVLQPEILEPGGAPPAAAQAPLEATYEFIEEPVKQQATIERMQMPEISDIETKTGHAEKTPPEEILEETPSAKHPIVHEAQAVKEQYVQQAPIQMPKTGHGGKKPLEGDSVPAECNAPWDNDVFTKSFLFYLKKQGVEGIPSKFMALHAYAFAMILMSNNEHFSDLDKENKQIYIADASYSAIKFMEEYQKNPGSLEELIGRLQTQTENPDSLWPEKEL